MTCSNCIHFFDCLGIDGRTRYYGPSEKACNNIEDKCNFFKNSAYFIEVPVEIGQLVWFIRNKQVIATYVEKIILKHNGLYLKLACNSMYETSCKSIGKTIFLKKQDADKAVGKESNKI